jgi:predicted dehydrogenase
MRENIKWGILGPGIISRKFATALLATEGAELAAVGSRSLERAGRFASEFCIPRVYGNYKSLAEDAELDAIYIGTPHSHHKEHTIRCLRAGRHVLCEKPFAINAVDAANMLAVAREEKRTLMEAMWMRFMPSIVKVRKLVAEGSLGEIRRVTADFGFRAEFNPKNRLFDLSLGGGALLDVGIYPVSLAHMLLGEPDTVEGTAYIGNSGVDEESSVILGFAGEKHAVLTMAIRRETRCDALILGTAGSIRIPKPWWKSEHIVVTQKGRAERTIELPYTGNGYTYEAEEFMDLIRIGRLESEVIPLDESLAIMKLMDKIRHRWGLKYPME